MVTFSFLQLLQELAILKESLQERDASLMDMKKENQQLKKLNHEVQDHINMTCTIACRVTNVQTV